MASTATTGTRFSSFCEFMKGELSHKRRTGFPASDYVDICVCGRKRVTRAPAAFSVADQNAFGHECQNIAQCCIRRTLRELGIFRSREFTLEPVEEPIQNQTLPLIDRFRRDALPKLGFIEHGGESGLCTIDGTAQA